ncbi:Methyltransferase domain-containing protein [Streptomyces sp. LcepLS]|nr:methyltransferase domain-containing protein [Streptomyces sp. SID4945]SCF31819.1 Methyltransferase domain-containing protein [Streptomyces sp. LcepLS]
MDSLDLPRSFTIRESGHRVHNPFTEEQLALLGRAIGLRPGMRVLDLACGSGEMLCTWSRAHGVGGTGVDISTVFLAAARARADALGVDDDVRFVHADASGFVAEEPVDVAACLGATWIGDGVPGTLGLLRRSLRPGGLLLVGEPYWAELPPDEETARACDVPTRDTYPPLDGLLESFGPLGYDVVEMVLAEPAGWDRYVAAQWLTTRHWLDAHPRDPMAPELRAELDTAAVRHARYRRRYLGWGVFALMAR